MAPVVETAAMATAQEESVIPAKATGRGEATAQAEAAEVAYQVISAYVRSNHPRHDTSPATAASLQILRACNFGLEGLC